LVFGPAGDGVAAVYGEGRRPGGEKQASSKQASKASAALCFSLKTFLLRRAACASQICVGGGFSCTRRGGDALCVMLRASRYEGGQVSPRRAALHNNNLHAAGNGRVRWRPHGAPPLHCWGPSPALLLFFSSLVSLSHSFAATAALSRVRFLEHNLVYSQGLELVVFFLSKKD